MWQTGRLRRNLVAAGLGLGVVLALVGAGCSSSAKKSAAPTTAASRAPGTTTPASCSAPPSSGASPTATASTDPLAVALNGTLLSATEAQQALGLSASLTPEPPGAPGAAGATPQGPISEQGVLGVVPNAAVYKPIYDGAGGGVGANVTYHAASPELSVDVLAVKFPNQQCGESFIQQSTNLVTTLAQGKSSPSPGPALGVLPAAQQVILRVPPGALTGTDETVAADILYGNGVFYLFGLAGAPGLVTEAEVVGLAKAQDAKYQAAKATLGAGAG